MNMAPGRKEMAAFDDGRRVLYMTEWGDLTYIPDSDMSDDVCITNLFSVPDWFDLVF
jgi:hypothetical protein